jgi:hypothetical protein
VMRKQITDVSAKQRPRRCRESGIDAFRRRATYR